MRLLPSKCTPTRIPHTPNHNRSCFGPMDRRRPFFFFCHSLAVFVVVAKGYRYKEKSTVPPAYSTVNNGSSPENGGRGVETGERGDEQDWSTQGRHDSRQPNEKDSKLQGRHDSRQPSEEDIKLLLGERRQGSPTFGRI